MPIYLVPLKKRRIRIDFRFAESEKNSEAIANELDDSIRSDSSFFTLFKKQLPQKTNDQSPQENRQTTILGNTSQHMFEQDIENYDSRSLNNGFQEEKLFSFDDLWNMRYRELLQYKLKYGHCNVPQRYEPNKALGKWVHHNKQLLKKGCNLRKDRVDSLEMIEFSKKVLTSSEKTWYKRYTELVNFQKVNGHCDVPQRYHPNLTLGKWVHRQRHSLNKKNGRLSNHRVKLLHDIGFKVRSECRSIRQRNECHNTID